MTNSTSNKYLAPTGGFAPCLETETLPRLYAQLFKKPQPHTWAHLHDLDLEQLNRRCENHWTKTSRLLHSSFLAGVIGAIMGLALIVLLDSRNPLSGSTYHLVKVYLILAPFSMAVCGLLMVNGAAFLKQFLFVEATARIQQELALLSDSEHGCSQALFLVNQSANAKTYRDAVLWTGRELREIDLLVMQDLFRQEEKVREDAQRVEDCKAVHAIA